MHDTAKVIDSACFCNALYCEKKAEKVRAGIPSIRDSLNN